MKCKNKEFGVAPIYDSSFFYPQAWSGDNHVELGKAMTDFTSAITFLSKICADNIKI